MRSTVPHDSNPRKHHTLVGQVRSKTGAELRNPQAYSRLESIGGLGTGARFAADCAKRMMDIAAARAAPGWSR